jgi:predicted NBD/HSP70 family sugar kinase
LHARAADRPGKKRPSQEILCFDVGGTFTRTGIWDGEKLRGYERVRTISRRERLRRAGVAGDAANADGAQRALRDWIVAQARRRLGRNPRVRKVAISIGAVVSRSGRIASTSQFWGSASVGLPADDISSCLGYPVFVVNDLVATAVRYSNEPQVDGASLLMALSVGSGIGSKLYDLDHRRVLLGSSGRDGEIGLSYTESHRYHHPDFLVPGTLGQCASGPGTVRLAQLLSRGRLASDYRRSVFRLHLSKKGLTLDSSDFHRVAVEFVRSIRQEDPFATRVLRSSVARLATVLHVGVLLCSPDKIIVSGGFARAIGPSYRRLLVEEMSRRLASLYTRSELESMICDGIPDDLDGLIGAGRVASEASQHCGGVG